MCRHVIICHTGVVINEVPGMVICGVLFCYLPDQEYCVTGSIIKELIICGQKWVTGQLWGMHG